MKIQGNNAALILVVAADGTIREVTIAKSSGQPDLDESLLRAVRNIPQLPAFTPDMTEATIQLKLPVRGSTRP